MPFNAISIDNQVTKDIKWEPTEKQRRFIEIPDEVFEGFYGGAVGGGKSEVLLMLPLCRGWYKNPAFLGVIFRRTLRELKRSLMERARDLYPKVGGQENKTDNFWIFPSGATIYFSYMESMTDAKKHDTAEYHYVAVDELTHHDEDYIMHIQSRIRSVNPDLPSIFRAASNPSHRGHRWVRKRYIEPARDGGKLIRDKESAQYRIFIPSSLTDNPYLTETDPQYAARLKNLPEAQRKAYVEGDWWSVSGKVFTELSFDKTVKEPEKVKNASYHICKAFPIPFYWPRIVAIDWGWDAFTWIGWAAISPVTNRVYVYREYCKRKTLTSKWSRDMANLSAAEIISAVALDPSAWQKRGDPSSIAERYQDISGYSPIKAGNDRIGGRLVLHDYLSTVPENVIAPPDDPFDINIYRRLMTLHGPAVAKNYKNMYQPLEAACKPGVMFFDKSPEGEPIEYLPSALQDCVFAENNPEDIAEFNGDDPVDGFRYMMKLCDDIIRKGLDAEMDDEYKNFMANSQRENESYTDFALRMAMKSRGENNDGAFALFGGRAIPNDPTDILHDRVPEGDHKESYQGWKAY